MADEPDCGDASSVLKPAVEVKAANTDFTDGRPRGEFKSHYPLFAWTQIAAEASYLVVVAAVAAWDMLAATLNPTFVATEVKFLGISTAFAANQSTRLWIVVFCAGVLGATTFSFKWLYHGVAWKEWHRDRIVWRLIVPIQGGMLAVFTGCMIIAGIVPLLSKETFQRLATAAGYGFMVGLFADNFLAALQRLAQRLLGTLGRTA